MTKNVVENDPKRTEKGHKELRNKFENFRTSDDRWQTEWALATDTHLCEAPIDRVNARVERRNTWEKRKFEKINILH